MSTECGLWVFGYGSLCWNPGFEYKKSMTGFVKGFGRKFWQGNATHRGTSDKPGRVATLVKEREGTVYGRAFEVKNSAALPYLQKRECTLGGYLTTMSTFHSRDGKSNFPVVIYIAAEKNEHWLGEAPLSSIARQISECAGPSGHNVEYLLRLADFMRRYLPEAHDEHLFTLETLVLARVKEANMCLVTLMGNRDYFIEFEEQEEANALEGERDEDDNNAHANIPPKPNSFEIVSLLPAKTLRCLKM